MSNENKTINDFIWWLCGKTNNFPFFKEEEFPSVSLPHIPPDNYFLNNNEYVEEVLLDSKNKKQTN